MSGDKDSPDFPSKSRKIVHLERALQDKYRDILNEPVPERLKQLIEALKEKERRGAKKDGSDET